MSLNEVFPKPTVRQVIFQIRFPNLFYIESKIGDLQLDVMKEFPDSSLQIRRQIVIADVGPDSKIQGITDQTGSQGPMKIWSFSSPKGYKLNVLSDSLDITSDYHKTYDNPSSPNKFRDIIEFVLTKFSALMRVPVITRVGLRYIDECPLPERNTETYKRYYNTAFNFDRFVVENANELTFQTVIQRGDYSVRYLESLQRKDNGESFVILDFDAFALGVPPVDCLRVTDALHELAIVEYMKTLKEPVFDHMRGK